MHTPLDQLVLHSIDAPATAVLLVLTRAVHAGDIDTLVTLATRDDLPAAAVAKLRDVDHVRVRSAYAARPDVDLDDLCDLLAGDTREAVIHAAARTWGHEPAIGDICEAVMTAYTGIDTITAALPAIYTPRAAMHALAFLADRHDEDRLEYLATWLPDVVPPLVRIAAADPDTHHAIEAMLPRIMRHGRWRQEIHADEALPDPVRLAALDAQIALLSDLPVDDRWQGKDWLHEAVAAMLTIHQVHPVLDAMDHALDRLTSPAYMDSRGPALPTVATMRAAIDRRRTWDAGTSDTLRHAGRHAATGTNADDLATIAGYITATGAFTEHWDNAILRALLDNDHLPVGGVVQLLHRHPQAVAGNRDRFTAHLLTARLLDADARDPAVVGAVRSMVDQWPGYAVAHGLIDLLPDPEQAIGTIAGAMPRIHAAQLLGELLDAGRTDLALQLPAATLVVDTRAPRLGPWPAKALALLADHLGEHPDRWTAFETLSEDFPGTIGQLLAMVDHAVAP